MSLGSLVMLHLAEIDRLGCVLNVIYLNIASGYVFLRLAAMILAVTRSTSTSGFAATERAQVSPSNTQLDNMPGGSEVINSVALIWRGRNTFTAV